MVEEDDFEVGRIYPPLYKIRQCSVKIASDICQTAYQEKMASVYPEPEDKNDFIIKQLYDYDYIRLENPLRSIKKDQKHPLSRSKIKIRQS